jgi:hypothetical protein
MGLDAAAGRRSGIGIGNVSQQLYLGIEVIYYF